MTPSRQLLATASLFIAPLLAGAAPTAPLRGLNPEVGFVGASASVVESAGPVSVQVSLTAVSAQDVTIPFTVGGSATSSDASVGASPLVIPAGQLDGFILVSVTDDLLSEGTERVVLTLTTPVGGVLGAATVYEVVIEDNEPAATLGFDLASSSQAEGAGAAVLTLTLSSARTEDVLLDFTLSGTATLGGVDVSVAPASQLLIPGGNVAGSIVATVVSDSMDEPDEDLQVRFSSLENADYGAVTAHDLTILDDDDAPSVAFASSNATVVEDDPMAALGVELSAVSGFDVMVPITASGSATEGADFVFTPATLTIPAGASTGTVDVTVLDDPDPEGPETVTFSLGTPTAATLGALPTTVLLIIDDDGPQPSLSFSSAASTAEEAGGVQDLLVQLDGYASEPVTVDLTLGGTAQAGVDVNLLTTSLSIPVGALSGLVQLEVLEDTDPEPSETAVVTLVNPIGAGLGAPATHILTITDNDTLPVLTFTTPASSVSESAGVLSVGVELSAAASSDVTVPLVLSGSATPGGVDLGVLPQPLVIPAGDTIGQFDVTLVDDALYEGDEELIMDLGAVTGATAGAIPTHVLTVVEDDPLPVVQFPAFRTVVEESSGGFNLRLELDTVSGLDVVAPFQVAGEAAGPGDISYPAGPAVIPAGSTSVDIPVSVVVDRLPEPGERVLFTLLDGGTPGVGAPDGATLGAGSSFLVMLSDGNVGPVAKAPPLAPSVATILFDQRRVADPSATETIFLTNLHSAPVTLTELVLRGSGAFTATCQATLPVVLAPAASVGVDLQFLPSEPGFLEGTFSARQAGQGAPPLEVALSGRAIGSTGADVLITAGLDAFVEPGGQVWLEEYGFGGGSVVQVTEAVLGTDLDELFQWVRVGSQFGYTLPIPNGSYEVVIFSWEPVKQAPGQRLFDVLAEGAVIIDDLDLFDEVGRFTAFSSEPVVVTVTDGVLDLSFDASVAQALVSAVSVRSIPVLSSPTAALSFGIVDQGTEVTLDFVVENAGLHPGQIDQVTFGEPSLGSSEDFRIDHGGFSYTGNAGERTYAIDPPIDVPPGLTSVAVTFGPTEHEDNVFELELASTERGASFPASVAGTGGAEAGWGFLHPVPDFLPACVIDYDGNGVETVRLFGGESHTHEPGRQLATFTWQVNGATVATTDDTMFTFPLGDSSVQLEIGDDNVTPSFAADGMTLSVFGAGAVPGALVEFYDGAVAGSIFLLDNVPALPDFVQRLNSLQLFASGGTVGDSPFSEEVMVRWTGSVELPAPRSLEFVATGGADQRLFVNGVAASGPLTLGAGSHSIEVRFAVSALTELPIALEIYEGGSVASDVLELVTHDESQVAPVIHSMPTVGTDLGGNRIDISGFGFFPAAQVVVHWGAQDFALGDFDEYSAEGIVLTSPPGSGSIAVTVETPNGVSDVRTFNYSPTGPIPVRFDLLTSVEAVVNKATSAAWGPDGKLYVSSLTGSIHVITYGDDYSVLSNEFKVGVSNLTNRDTLGVVFNPYDVYDPQDPSSIKLYVSHGEHFLNGGGAFSGPSDFAGQISVLSGPDFDSPVPLVTGLPQSNHDHAINGMFVDDNGDLLLCSGGNTNGGIKWPLSGDLPESPLSAALLKICISRPGFNGTILYEDSVTGALVTDQVLGEQVDVASGVDVEVYAPGLRNSLDVVLHSNGHLYATDNGANSNYGPASLSMTTQGGLPHPSSGDTLDLVEPGRFYGEANRARGRYDDRQAVYHDNEDPSIPHLLAAPLRVLSSSTNGIDEYRATAFNSAMRGNLVAMKWNGGMWQITLSESGRDVDTHILHGMNGAPFPKNRGLDVVTGPGGAILSIDYSGNRVRAQTPDDAAAVGLTPYDILPWRAPSTGGQRFVIGGQNFGTNASVTSVFIGGVAATITSVSETRIVGLLPPSASGGATDALDVEVQVGVDSKTIPEAFRYMQPAPGMKLGRWREADPAPVGLAEVSAGEIGGQLFLFGSGSNQTVSYDAFQESYSTARAGRPFAGGGHAAVTMDGLLYLFGGFGAGAAGKVQVYDPATDSWTLGSSMPWDAGGCVAAVVDGLIYVGGGVAPSGGTVGNFASYDPVLDSWTTLPVLPMAVHLAAAGSDGQRFLVMGGRTGSLGPQAGVDEVQAFDPSTGTWASSSSGALAPLPLPTSATGPAIFWDGELYVFGGADASSALTEVQVYDPSSDSWRAEAPLQGPRQGACAVLFESRAFLIGGSDGPASSPLQTGEVFSPR